MSGVALSEITVDRLGRPVVRVEIPGGESFLAHIDTGFNGEMMLAEFDARRLGFTIATKAANVTVAGDVVQRVMEGSGTIHWFGEARRVELYVSTATPSKRMDDGPVALIGTRLLIPHLLLVDFARGTVEIEAQE